jgi:hypothetical protein
MVSAAYPSRSAELTPFSAVANASYMMHVLRATATDAVGTGSLQRFSRIVIIFGKHLSTKPLRVSRDLSSTRISHDSTYLMREAIRSTQRQSEAISMRSEAISMQSTYGFQ